VTTLHFINSAIVKLGFTIGLKPENGNVSLFDPAVEKYS